MGFGVGLAAFTAAKAAQAIAMLAETGTADFAIRAGDCRVGLADHIFILQQAVAVIKRCCTIIRVMLVLLMDIEGAGLESSS
jgi:hypothetical protein